MCEVIVITSGKGGVGKTTLTANLGAGIAALGHKTLLIDADIGLRNLDVVMGLEHKITYHMMDVMDGNCRLKQALIQDRRYPKLYLIASSQRHSAQDIDAALFAQMISALKKEFEYILIDCPAGIERGFQIAVSCADSAVVVTTPDIAAIRDADKVIRILQHQQVHELKLLINRLVPEMVYYGDMLGTNDITDILPVPLLGVIPFKNQIMMSYNRGDHLIDHKSDSAEAISNICRRLTGNQVPMIDWEKKITLFTKMSYKFEEN